MNRFGNSMENLRCSGASPERNDIADFYEERDRQESFRARDEAKAERNRVWSLIQNKAHLYSTAYSLQTGEYIQILGVRTVGVFACLMRDGTEKDIGCEMLHDYRV